MINVLLAEDDEKLLDVFGRFLRMKGWHVREARDGQQAVAQACQEPADIVVLDVKMPKLDGLSACREIRRNCPTTPMILMTGYRNSPELDALVRQGQIYYLHKPFTLEQLSATVQSMVGQRVTP
jgi:two-component system response regulator HydG